MAITFTQAQVDAAVTYLMTGGAGGGELTNDQYRAMIWRWVYPGSSTEQNMGIPGCLTNFAYQLQLAINQNHSGLGSSRNICRDKWGALDDVFMSRDGAHPLGPKDRPGFARGEVANLNISISG